MNQSRSNPLVELWILSHNRPFFLMEMIQSLKAQTYKNTKIIISENSTEESVIAALKDVGGVEVRQRIPHLDGRDHLEKVLSEVHAPYCMILHDDDIALPEMVQTLIEILDSNPECVAASANAYVLEDQNKTRRLLAKGLRKKRVIRHVPDLARSYLTEDSDVSPFPGYLYRSKHATEVRASIRAVGRVSDVSFLCSLLGRGAFIQLPQPLMFYRLHSGQDSQSIALRNKSTLIHWLIKQNILMRDEPLLVYARLRNLVRSPKFPSAADNMRRNRRRSIYLQSLVLFLRSPHLLLRLIRNKLRKLVAG